MVLELIFLTLLVFAVTVIAYRGAVHEFQILQKTYDDDDTNFAELLSEMLPIVIRAVTKTWLGGWTAARVSQKHYEIQVQDPKGRKFQVPWIVWLKDPQETTPVSLQPVAASLERASTAMADDGFTRWMMLPHGAPVPSVLHASKCATLRKVVPEFTVITVTDGAPLDVWLAHEGAIPSDTPTLLGKNPWEVTTATVPWIGDVKYIEIRLRPNNTLAIPRHWSYALRNSTEELSWYHTSEFHTPISKIISVVKNDKQRIQ